MSGKQIRFRVWDLDSGNQVIEDVDSGDVKVFLADYNITVSMEEAQNEYGVIFPKEGLRTGYKEIKKM